MLQNIQKRHDIYNTARSCTHLYSKITSIDCSYVNGRKANTTQVDKVPLPITLSRHCLKSHHLHKNTIVYDISTLNMSNSNNNDLDKAKHDLLCQLMYASLLTHL